MKNYNEIKLGEHNLLWANAYDEAGCCGCETYCYTKFYHGTETRTYKKYLFFGPTVVKVQPKYAFRVEVVMNDLKITREECNRRVMEAYNKWVSLTKRKDEVKNGVYI